jgi:hypothetical protein
MKKGHSNGFAKILGHKGPAIPDRQRNIIGVLFASHMTVENGWIARLHEGDVVLVLRNRKKSYTRKYNAPYSERWVRVDEAGGVAGSVFMDDALNALTSDKPRHVWRDQTFYFGDMLMLIPHQTSTLCSAPIDWDVLDPVLSPPAEIYSHWGSDDHYGNPLQCIETGGHPPSFVDVALKRGYRLGFIGSTDEHGGAPGDGILDSVVVDVGEWVNPDIFALNLFLTVLRYIMILGIVPIIVV